MNIGQEIIRRVDEAIEKEKQPEGPPPGYNRASELGWWDDCPRYLCLRRLCPEKEAPKSKSFRRRLREGRKQELLIANDLELAGFELRSRPRLIWDKHRISGEIDREIKANGDFSPIDFKTCSSAMFPRLEKLTTAEALLHSDFYWVRHYPAQLSTYMLMLQKQQSVILFKDKDSGLFHTVDIELDPSYASQIVGGADEVNIRVEKEDPFPAEYKPICQDCGFFAFDFPDTDKATLAQGDIETVDDEEWLVKLAEHQEFVDGGLTELIKKFEKLDKEIKGAFQGRRVMIGSHVVESKGYLQTYYDVPDDLKEKFKKQAQRYRASIKHLAEAL